MSQWHKSGKEILAMVVDDHNRNRELIVRQLGNIGISADVFHNGSDALRAWSPGAYDVVITDCHMPQLDGYALARAIRRLEADLDVARMPIIAWTVNLFATEAHRCRAAGMDDVMVKPSTTTSLRIMLERWVTLAGGASGLLDLQPQESAARHLPQGHDGTPGDDARAHLASADQLPSLPD